MTADLSSERPVNREDADKSRGLQSPVTRFESGRRLQGSLRRHPGEKLQDNRDFRSYFRPGSAAKITNESGGLCANQTNCVEAGHCSTRAGVGAECHALKVLAPPLRPIL